MILSQKRFLGEGAVESRGRWGESDSGSIICWRTSGIIESRSLITRL